MQPARTLISRDQIAARIGVMGRELTSDLNAKTAGDPKARVVLVPILTGALVFTADLIRHVPVQMSIRPVTVSSYPGTATSSQGANIHGAVPTDLGGAHVIIVDDILDSGRTLGLLRRVIEAQRPASVQIAVLLRKSKSGGRDEHVEVEHVGFEIEDEFVIGYGLDYDGYFRNLPDIGVMVP
jgi:hypoxanthine phosphoribosyltransferase